MDRVAEVNSRLLAARADGTIDCRYIEFVRRHSEWPLGSGEWLDWHRAIATRGDRIAYVDCNPVLVERADLALVVRVLCEDLSTALGREESPRA